MSGAESCDIIRCGTRRQWLEARRQTIGASDVAVLMGVAPEGWGSPYSLYLNKTGQLPETEAEVGSPMWWGHRLEPLLARWVHQHTGLRVENPGPWTTCRSREYPWLSCTPDRVIYTPVARRLLELKTAGSYRRADWEEGIPVHYRYQLQTSMIVCDEPLGFLAVLIGKNGSELHEDKRDQAVCDNIIEVTREFWRRVETHSPPPIDGLDATRNALRAQYPRDDGSEIMLPAEAMDIDGRLQIVEREIADLQRERQEYRNVLLSMMGEASVGRLPGDNMVYWTNKLVRKAAYEVAATSYRSLNRRVKQQNGKGNET